MNQVEQKHTRVICDGCQMTPIPGIRYMCSVCSNFDLCFKCEAKGVHIHHPMLKIRKAHQAPHSFICQYTNIDAVCAEPNIKEPSQKAKKAEKILKKGEKLLKARFVRESIGDKYEVVSGSKFVKQWVFKNDGETTWPPNVAFVQSSGDPMKGNPVFAHVNVLPDSEHTWEVEMTAPQGLGRYTAFFRLQTGEGKKFGHKVWCDILVIEAPKLEEVPYVPLPLE